MQHRGDLITITQPQPTQKRSRTEEEFTSNKRAKTSPSPVANNTNATITDSTTSNKRLERLTPEEQKQYYISQLKEAKLREHRYLETEKKLKTKNDKWQRSNVIEQNKAKLFAKRIEELEASNARLLGEVQVLIKAGSKERNERKSREQSLIKKNKAIRDKLLNLARVKNSNQTDKNNKLEELIEFLETIEAKSNREQELDEKIIGLTKRIQSCTDQLEELEARRFYFLNPENIPEMQKEWERLNKELNAQRRADKEELQNCHKLLDEKIARVDADINARNNQLKESQRMLADIANKLNQQYIFQQQHAVPRQAMHNPGFQLQPVPVQQPAQIQYLQVLPQQQMLPNQQAIQQQQMLPNQQALIPQQQPFIYNPAMQANQHIFWQQAQPVNAQTNVADTAGLNFIEDQLRLK